MGASVVVRPTTEPVSLGEARAHLRIDTPDADAQLAGHILAARQWCEAYTRRVFITQTWDATFDDWPMVGREYRLDLPFAPLVSVSQVTYTDESNLTQTLPASDYLVRGSGAENLPYIVPAYGVTWPSLLDVPENVRVRFVAGYGSPGDVPEPIRAAILLQAELLYDRNPASKDLLEAARNALLDPYRVVRV